MMEDMDSRRNSAPTASVSACSPTLLTIATVFLHLGGTAFGGPAAHIALMEAELVRRRKWLSHEEFLDLLGAANLLPGPSSTEMAIQVGFKKGGLLGLAIAGVCFILPAFLMVSIIAALYLQFGKLTIISAALYGLKPVIIAIVFQALWALSKTSLKTSKLKVTAIIVFALYLLGVNQIVLLFGCGLIATVVHFAKNDEKRETLMLAVVGSASAALIAFTYFLSSYTPKNLAYSPAALFFYFLKLGSVLYGGGYVLLAFLRSDLVENYHWITSTQLLDAVAVGQITPGPLFTTATFIGSTLGGPIGAVLATVGIFLPAFVLVALSAPLIKKMRTSALAGKFLDAVNAAAVALMAGVLFQLGRDALIDAPAFLIGVVSGLILMRLKPNSVWLMLCGAIAGLIFHCR